MASPPSVYLTALTPQLQSFWDDDFNLEMCVRTLSLKQQAQVHLARDRLLKHKKLLHHLFVKYVFNRILQDRDLEEPVPFTYTELGKPQFPGIEFNMSSSNVVLGIAVSHSQNPIGIDLSHEQQRIEPHGIVEQFRQIMSDSEAGQLESVADPWQRYLKFNHLWTLKEAYSKYLALGLNMDLAACSFSMEDLKDNHVEYVFPPNSDDRKEVLQLQVDWTPQTLHNETQKCYSCVVKPSKVPEQLPVMISLVYDDENTALAYYVDVYTVIQNFIR